MRDFCPPVRVPQADLLRTSVPAGTAASSPSAPSLPAALRALFARRGASFADARGGAYRVVAALGRAPWFAVELSQSSELLSSLCDPQAESGARACALRYAAVCALAEGAAAAEAGGGQAAGLAPGAAQRLEAARLAGLFGTGRGGKEAAAPLVATVP